MDGKPLRVDEAWQSYALDERAIPSPRRKQWEPTSAAYYPQHYRLRGEPLLGTLVPHTPYVQGRKGGTFPPPVE